MRKVMLAMLPALLLAGGMVIGSGASKAAPVFDGQAALILGTPQGIEQNPLIENAQFVVGGRRYCFYSSGWHGPGWYWCGYSFRRGFGWGGQPDGVVGVSVRAGAS